MLGGGQFCLVYVIPAAHCSRVCAVVSVYAALFDMPKQYFFVTGELMSHQVRLGNTHRFLRRSKTQRKALTR